MVLQISFDRYFLGIKRHLKRTLSYMKKKNGFIKIYIIFCTQKNQSQQVYCLLRVPWFAEIEFSMKHQVELEGQELKPVVFGTSRNSTCWSELLWHWQPFWLWKDANSMGKTSIVLLPPFHSSNPSLNINIVIFSCSFFFLCLRLFYFHHSHRKCKP